MQEAALAPPGLGFPTLPPRPASDRSEQRNGSGRGRRTAQRQGRRKPAAHSPSSSPPLPPPQRRRSGHPSRQASEAAGPPFPEHCSAEDAERRIAGGELFRAELRCNAGDRSQAFCTVSSLPCDVFVKGCRAQNRALEGDVVAIRILPLTEWHRQDKNAPTPPMAAQGNALPFGGRGQPAPRRAPLQRHITPPAWSQPTLQSPGSDLVASPALLPSPSGGELAFALESYETEDTACSAEPEGGAADAVADQMQGLRLGGSGAEGRSSKDGGATAAQPTRLQRSAASPAEQQQPAAAVPWVGSGSAEAAAASLAGLLQGEWKGWRATAQVVAVLNLSQRRQNVVGVLLADASGGGELLLEPCNPRLPQLVIPDKALPAAQREQLIREAHNAFAPLRTLVSGAIVGWQVDKALPEGEVLEVVGEAGGLEVETKALLLMEKVNDDDAFTPEVLACLPVAPWNVSDADIAERRDFRGKRVFSIDPPTARDLDDALSVEEVQVEGERLLRIGVHIADVSHFVRPGTSLDEEAAERSTSVYLIDRVIPMLPRPLCEELCSLNPGVDRLAFSVVWDMSPEGAIKDTWIGRTIIRSCVKLSYGMVQEMIDGRHTGVEAEGPPSGGATLHGLHSWSEVVRDALALHVVAVALRRRRFHEWGALRLDNVRLSVQLDPATGEPVSLGTDDQTEANRLVEEFMLAANMTVARTIAAAFPDRALLRCHPPPREDKMLELAGAVQKLLPSAPPLDVSSAGALQATLRVLCSAVGNPAVAEVVTLLCTKPMQPAKYFCTGTVQENEAAWRHYALAVQHYTHFTSPIRRYPDVIVHRLLAAAVGAGALQAADGKLPEDAAAAACEQHGLLPKADVAALAAHANVRKAAAKAVQDGCLRLYLTAFLLERPTVCEGIVMQLGGPRFFDVYVPLFGIDVRIHTELMLHGGEAALYSGWNAETKTLVLDLSNCGANAVRTQEDEPCYDDIPNAAAASNGSGLQRAPLPVSLRPLCTVAVLVGAQRSKTTGSPASIHAKLWVQ